MGVNKVILIGNLGDDPDVKETKSGSLFCTLSVATSNKWKTKDGEKKEKTEWHRVVVWNEGLVGIIEQYCKKGSKVYLEGELQTRKWEDKDGNDRYTTEVVLPAFGSKLELLGDGGGGRSRSRDDDEDRGASRSRRRSTSHSEDRRSRRDSRDDDDEDEIPF